MGYQNESLIRHSIGAATHGVVRSFGQQGLATDLGNNLEALDLGPLRVRSQSHL